MNSCQRIGHNLKEARVPNTFMVIQQTVLIGKIDLFLFTFLSESTSNFAHVYSYGTEACEFLHNLLQVPIHNLQTLLCPHPHKLNSHYRCNLTCHKNFSDVHCAVKHVHALYNWLEYHLQTTQYVRCPKDMTHRTAMFSSGIKKSDGVIRSVFYS